MPKKLTIHDVLALLGAPFLFTGAISLFVAAFSYGLASSASALQRTTMLFVVLLAGKLLGEKHPERIVGAALITLGAILLVF